MSTDYSALRRWFEKAQKEIADQILSQLSQLGVECVNRARTNGTYTDRTGNLRSSIGMAVYDQGKKIAQSAFESMAVAPDKKNKIPGGSGAEGSQAGLTLIEQIAAEYERVYGLAIVAGMEYASDVEYGGEKNRKPHDVLASTQAWAEEQLNKRIEKAIKQAVTRMNRVPIQ